MPSPETFDEFFRSEIDRLIGFLCKTGYLLEVAKDAAAEAMALAYEKWHEIVNPRAWVRRVAQRVASKYQLEGPRSVAKAIAAGWGVAERYDDGQRQARVEEQPQIIALLRRLPDRQRMLMAWELDGFMPIEIANEMEMAPDTVRSNLRHARARLKQIYLAEFQQSDPVK